MGNDRIHVLHIRDTSGIFGAEQVIFTLANNLDKKKFNVSILCLQKSRPLSKPLIDKANEFNIRIFQIPVYKKIDFTAVKKIRKLFQKQNVNIIHSHDYKSDFYGLIASIGLSLKRVTTAHGSTKDSLKKKAYLFCTEMLLYRFFDRVIAVSSELQFNLAKKRILKDKVRLIQNCLDFSMLNKGENNHHSGNPLQNFPDGAKVFIVVGRLFPDKGHRFFLQAFQKVLQKYPMIIALIVGDGPSREIIQQHIRELGIEKSVLLTGIRNDMNYIYSLADFMVIPSLREGLPYVLLEAMANTIPVIATSVGDIPLLIKNHVTGCLVAPGDVQELVVGIELLLGSPDLSALMAKNALRLIKMNFSVEQMINKTEKLYYGMK